MICNRMKFARGLMVLALLVGLFAMVGPASAALADYPSKAEEINPHKDLTNPAYKAIYTAPYESKALMPVTFVPVESGKPLTLIANGKPAVTIVAANAAYYKSIAKFLKEYLDLATGTSFKVTTNANVTGKAIFIGPVKNAAVIEAFKSTQPGKFDNFIMRSFDKGIMLVGKDADPKYGTKKGMRAKSQSIRIKDKYYSRGTYFATLDFVERFIGVRWYGPNRIGTYVPDLRKSKIVVPSVEYKDEPVYLMRRIDGVHSGYDAKFLRASFRDSSLWLAKRRASDGALSMVNHTDSHWHEFYAKQHPDWFAMRRNGTRMTHDTANPQSSQRCYTNEAAFQEHLKKIEEWYKFGNRTGEEYKVFAYRDQVPNDKFVYWMPNDGFPGCFCPDCKALSVKHGDKYTPRTIQEFYYLNKLAREVQKRWPGKSITFNLYGLREIPDLFEMPKNIAYSKVFNGYPETFWKEKKYYDFAQKLVDDVSKASSEKFAIYSHYPAKPRMINLLDLPYMVPKTLTKFYRDNVDKVEGTHFCSYPWTSYAHDIYILYLQHTLLWNPNVDPDALLDEFTTLFFGPAGAEMNEYFKLLITQWEDKKWSYVPDVADIKGKGLTWTYPNEAYWTENYPATVRNKMAKLLEAGIAKTPAPSVYHERMQWYNEWLKKFFKQGKMADESISMSAECTPTRKPIRIDGNLGEWVGRDPMILKECMTGKSSKVKTEFFTTYDKKNFYVAGKVYESDKMILPAEKLPRDGNVWEYDSVEIFLCPDQLGDNEGGFNKRGRFFQIMLNANGDVLDAHMPLNSGRNNPKFTLDFTHAEKPMGKGFQFEVKIPLASMEAMTPKPGSHWAANFYRNRKRDDGTERYYAWSPTMGEPFFKTAYFGELQFPVKPLFVKALGTGSVWTKSAGSATYSQASKNGITTIKVKLPENEPKARVIGFNLRGTGKPITAPIKAICPIRVNGKGIKKIQFYLKDSNTQKMEFNFKPDPDPNKVISTQEWRKAINNWSGKNASHKAREKLDNFNASGIIVWMKPGADFTIEAKPVKAYKR